MLVKVLTGCVIGGGSNNKNEVHFFIFALSVAIIFMVLLSFPLCVVDAMAVYKL